MKKIAACILTIILVLGLTACDSSKQKKEPVDSANPTQLAKQISIEEYRALVSNSVTEITNASILLSNLGKYEHDFWANLVKLGGTVTTEKISSEGRKWLAEKAKIEESKIDDDYKNIVDNYAVITGANVSNAEAETLNENLDYLFKSYSGLYTLTTSLTEDIDSFSSNYNDYTKEITNSRNVLSQLLGLEE